MAVKKTYRINLRNYGSPPAVMVSQYDEGYAIAFEIFDGPLPVLASSLSGYTFKLKGRQPGNPPFLAYEFEGTLATALNAVVSFEIDTTMTGRAGKGTAELVILDEENDVKFASVNFAVYTEPAAVPDGSIDADVERAQEIADEVAEIVDGATEGAEAWAVGQRGGVDVENTDPTYHNNAKYYVESISGVTDQVATNTSDISDLKEDLNAVKSNDFEQITGNSVLTNWVSGYYATQSSVTNVDTDSITANPTMVCTYAACSEGDVFEYTGYGTSSARSWAFLKENGDIISRAYSGAYTEEKITAPALSAMVVFNASATYGNHVVIKDTPIKARVAELEAKADSTDASIDRVENALSGIGVQTKVNATGELTSVGVIGVDSVTVTDATSAVVQTPQLFEQKLPTTTMSGVTVTPNSDGTYTINGTATGNTFFFLNQTSRVGTSNPIALDGTYAFAFDVVSGALTGGDLTVALRDLVANSTVKYVSYYSRKLIGYVSNNNIAVGIQVRSGTVYSNLRIAIMLNKGSEYLPWIKYKTPQTVSDFANLKAAMEQYKPEVNVILSPSTAKISMTARLDASVGSVSNDAFDAVTIYENQNVICANHRGYHNVFPENTLWAFAQSKLHGFDWIENDVRMTSDGVGVLLHDESINRTARNADGSAISETINIADITYEQALDYDFGISEGNAFAGTKIVTVEECIAFCKKVGLNILMEPKVAGSGTYCANLVKRYAMEDHVIWISFGAPQLQEVLAVLPTATVGFVTTDDPSASHITIALALKTADNKVFIDYNYTKSISNIRDSMVSNNIGYGVYTLDDASALATLDPYCSMITSNTLIASRSMAKTALSNWIVK